MAKVEEVEQILEDTKEQKKKYAKIIEPNFLDELVQTEAESTAAINRMKSLLDDPLLSENIKKSIEKAIREHEEVSETEALGKIADKVNNIVNDITLEELNSIAFGSGDLDLVGNVLSGTLKNNSIDVSKSGSKYQTYYNKEERKFYSYNTETNQWYGGRIIKDPNRPAISQTNVISKNEVPIDIIARSGQEYNPTFSDYLEGKTSKDYVMPGIIQSADDPSVFYRISPTSGNRATTINDPAGSWSEHNIEGGYKFERATQNADGTWEVENVNKEMLPQDIVLSAYGQNYQLVGGNNQFAQTINRDGDYTAMVDYEQKLYNLEDKGYLVVKNPFGKVNESGQLVDNEGKLKTDFADYAYDPNNDKWYRIQNSFSLNSSMIIDKQIKMEDVPEWVKSSFGMPSDISALGTGSSFANLDQYNKQMSNFNSWSEARQAGMNSPFDVEVNALDKYREKRYIKDPKTGQLKVDITYKGDLIEYNTGNIDLFFNKENDSQGNHFWSASGKTVEEMFGKEYYDLSNEYDIDEFILDVSKRQSEKAYLNKQGKWKQSWLGLGSDIKSDITGKNIDPAQKFIEKKYLEQQEKDADKSNPLFNKKSSRKKPRDSYRF